MNSLEILALLRAHEAALHRDASEWADVLADFQLFAGVGKRRLRRLVRGATFAEAARGDVVILSGDSSDSLYVILGGAARVLGRPAARELGVGEYFGEMGLIDGAPRSATIVATRDLHVMRLPAKSVLALARRDPAITLTMLRNLSTQLRRLEQVAP
jgi:CRP/FNR family cyclic AMP-dependent transcriptional regulator